MSERNPFSFELPVGELLAVVSAPLEVRGERSTRCTNLCGIAEATPTSLVFLEPPKKDPLSLLQQTKAAAVITHPSYSPLCFKEETCYVFTEYPREVFFEIAQKMFAPEPSWGIHPTAMIDPRAKWDEPISIGAYTVIGDCEIGAGTRIGNHCTLFDGVVLGKSVSLGPSTIVGKECFGYFRHSKGHWELAAQLGGVWIEDHVKVGAHVCIDRGTLKNTHLKRGVIIDNFAYIAHNVLLGENTFVGGHATLAGSVVVEPECLIWVGALIKEWLHIGKGAVIGMGAVVTKNVPAGATWAGVPARDLASIKGRNG